jgi:hypothetical protein
MNERIRQLADEAVNSIPDHVDFDIPDVFKEKFAELIVRECAMIARSTKREVDVDGGAVMRKHFGVKL